jgi:hypothetical protein
MTGQEAQWALGRRERRDMIILKRGNEGAKRWNEGARKRTKWTEPIPVLLALIKPAADWVRLYRELCPSQEARGRRLQKSAPSPM